jgi:hypothetical protein
MFLWPDVRYTQRPRFLFDDKDRGKRHSLIIRYGSFRDVLPVATI